MSVRAIRNRMMIFTAAVLAVVGVLWLSEPTTADAQSTLDAEGAIAVSHDAASLTRTAVVSLDAQTSGLAALTAAVAYDADQVEIISCEVGVVGACNDVGSSVRFSVLAPDGIGESPELLTIEFRSLGATTGESSFTIDVETAVDEGANPLDVQVKIDDITFDLQTVAPGSLTGDVLDADSRTGLFAIEVCAVDEELVGECVETTGLGSWRINDLGPGAYTVSFVDPTANYASSASSAIVVSEQVTTGVDAELALAGDDNEAADPDAVTPPVADETPAPPAPVGAGSMSGLVLDQATGEPVFAAQVCARHVVTDHTSCSGSNLDGEFAIDGLFTSNYRLTLTDPIGRYIEPESRLIGLVSPAHVTDIEFVLSR